MLKRKLFFWLERLNITRQERIAVLSLTSLLFSLILVNHFYEPSPDYDRSDYARLRARFEARTAALKQEQQQLMARYKPIGQRTNQSFPAADTTDTTHSHPNLPQADKSKKDSGAKVSLIDINKASVTALEALPGVGPAIAGRIVAYRKKHGLFQTIKDLREVKGIGKKRLEKIRPFIKL